MFSENGATQTLRSIKNDLVCSLKNKYGIENKEIRDSILKIHGLHKDNFDFIKNIETVINERLNDVSIDDNSNKNEKTIEGLFQEVFQPAKKATGYDYLYQEMKQTYGKKEAKRLAGEMYDYSLIISDSTNILKVYCYAIDASKLVLYGRDFGVLHSKPSKRVSSYISALSETVHALANSLAGAVAVGSFFLDVSRLLLIQEKVSLEDIKNNPVVRKQVENEFQQFVHSINHLSRSSVESPFSNVTVNCRDKLLKLVDEKDGYYWYFEEGNDRNLSVEDYQKFLVDYIFEVQKIFIEFFDKGDPLQEGLPYRFPVTTVAFSKDDEKNKIIDEDFLNYMVQKDIYRYNLFVSQSSKMASCCRLLSDTEMLELGGFTNSFGGSSISLGSHRVISLNLHRIVLESKTKEDYFNLLDERVLSTVKILKAHKQLIETFKNKGLQEWIDRGYIDVSKLFSTIGLIGIAEANDRAKKHYNLDSDFIEDTLKFIEKKAKELSKEFGLIINIEQTPAESQAPKTAYIDSLLFGKEEVPYELYSNQFIPLWEDATIWERMEVDGKYNKLITGGGIVHAQIGEQVTPKQAKKIIEFSVESGSEHFALNSVWSKCVNEHTTFGKVKICPKCSGKIENHYTRVVGFFVPVQSWNKTRREWEFDRRKFVNLD